MKIIYRISDGGHNKVKPPYVTKKRCFTHFYKIFKNYEINVIADNICDDTYQFLLQYVDASKITITSLGNSKSFIYCANFAINNFHNNDKVYFAEDDYLYLENAPQIIEEGLEIADYSSGYDHPDKYVNHSQGGPNPFIESGGELTRVLISKNRHWKLTNSCCMTFATTVKIIKEDFDIYQKYCNTSTPDDFRMFSELIKNKNRKLVSCLPAVSTHGETLWLSKFID